MSTSIRSTLKIVAIIFWSVFTSTGLFAQPRTITILHTNDIHASFFPHEAIWIKNTPRPFIGGFNELSYAVDSLRRVKEWTLLLDAGDVMAGNPITEYEYKGAEGGALFEMMNFVGYDTWTPGNHDFTFSVANLKNLTRIAGFPTISANILDSGGAFPINNKEYIIIEKNEIKIGIIGLMSDDFYNLVHKKGNEGIKILPSVKTVRRLVDTLSKCTDILIVLSHQGVDYDSILAMNVKGLDVIVGGHSHTRLKHPKVVNGVIIVQAGSNCENLGILDLTIDSGRVVRYDGELLPLWYNSARGATPLSMFIDSIKNKIDSDYSEVIGTLKTDWRRGHGESGVANFITDAQRESAGADVAFMNSGSIRKDLPAGPITRLDVYEILPFRNILTKFELTGRQIRRIVEYYIQEKPSIQTSGLSVKWRQKKGKDIEFVEFLVNGKPLDENAVYVGTANDYMIDKIGRYLGIDGLKVTYLDQTVSGAVEKKIREVKKIESPLEHRIKRVR